MAVCNFMSYSCRFFFSNTCSFDETHMLNLFKRPKAQVYNIIITYSTSHSTTGGSCMRLKKLSSNSFSIYLKGCVILGFFKPGSLLACYKQLFNKKESQNTVNNESPSSRSKHISKQMHLLRNRTSTANRLSTSQNRLTNTMQLKRRNNQHQKSRPMQAIA